jgi:glycerol-3-phosphate dehydrogenase (NAD(P)+)
MKKLTRNQEKVSEICNVLGGGTWGTALAQHLALQGNNVCLWTRNIKICESINKDRCNVVYAPDFQLSDKIKATCSIAELNFSAEAFTILAVPSNSVLEVYNLIREHINEGILINGVKGLIESGLTSLQLAQNCNLPFKAFVVLSGPCFAINLLQGQPAGLVVASDNSIATKKVVDLFSGRNMRLYTSNDTLGVELGGILKNIIAVAVGISDGLELGDSARSALITRGLAEMNRFAVSLGAKRETLFGLSGLGDLVMTATCDKSRNRSFGFLVGLKNDVKLASNEYTKTVEAIYSLPHVVKCASQNNIFMPIAETLKLVLEKQISPKDAVSKLLARPFRAEYDDSY